MTSQLSSILQQITSANVSGKQDAQQAKLIQGLTLENAKHVNVAVQPNTPTLLSIRGTELGQVNVKLNAPINTQNVKQWQLASILDATKPSPILFAQRIDTKTISTRSQAAANVINSIANTLTNLTGINVSVQATVVSVSSRNVTLFAKNQTVVIPVQGSSWSKGDSVQIALETAKDSPVKANIAQTHSGQPTPLLTKPSLTSLPLPIKTIESIVGLATQQAGISVKADSASPLSKTTLGMGLENGNALKQIVNLRTTGGNLKVTSASLEAVATLTAPNKQWAEQVPQLRQLTLPDALRLPTGKVVQTVPSSATSEKRIINKPSEDSPLVSNTTGAKTSSSTVADNQTTGQLPLPKSGSEVHQSIITLSRQLLSQTGSTTVALSQLITSLSSLSTQKPNSSIQPTESDVSPTTKAIVNGVLKQLTSIEPKSVLSNKTINTIHAFSPLPSTKATQRAITTESLPTASQNNKGAASDVLNIEGNATRTIESQRPIATAQAAKTGFQSNAQTPPLANTGGIKVADSKTTSIDNRLIKASMNIGTEKPSMPKELSARLSALKDMPIQIGTQPNIVSVSQDNLVQTSNPSHATDSAQDLPQRIANIIQSPFLLTPQTLTGSGSSSTFVQGLVTLLQLSLAGKAVQRSPNLKAKIDVQDSIVSKAIPPSHNGAPPSRITQDLANLDLRSSLIENLRTLLANHQQSKLANADTRIQNQDSLFFVLPTLSHNVKAPELKIYRDPEHNSKNAPSAKKRGLWNITMKLDIGSQGQMLAKAKIQENTVQLNLYTSSPTLLPLVADTLPFLTRRLEQLGLAVEKSTVQQGKIPESLNNSPHRIFETMV